MHKNVCARSIRAGGGTGASLGNELRDGKLTRTVTYGGRQMPKEAVARV